MINDIYFYFRFILIINLLNKNLISLNLLIV